MGEQIGIDWASAAFDVDQFRAGMEVEPEHGSQDPADSCNRTLPDHWSLLKTELINRRGP